MQEKKQLVSSKYIVHYLKGSTFIDKSQATGLHLVHVC
jgi:hypothetical protein